MSRNKILHVFNIFLATLLVIAGVNLRVLSTGTPLIRPVAEIPRTQAILILGASVYRNGEMSAIYRDRAQTALELYNAGKAPIILVSGDNSTTEYDEVTPVKNFLTEHGVPSSSVVLDYAGFDTYDSIYRARDIFGITSTVVVTQNFHLPRALYIANRLGIRAHGVNADLREYRTIRYLHLREYGARVKAWWNVLIGSKPKFLGDKIPLPET